jgi:serine protease
MRRFGVATALAVSSMVGMAAPKADEDPAAAQAADELVADLDDHLSDEEVAKLEARYDASFLPVSSNVRTDRIYRVRVHSTDEAQKPALLRRLLTALRSDREVEAADYALIYRLPETAPGALTGAADEGLPLLAGDAPSKKDDPRRRIVPNDPKYKYQWHLDQIHMPEAWATAQGAGVTVAVIDTGVTKVEDLSGTEIVPGWNFVNNTDDARDDHGHGTHVAGTIAQTTNNGVGVAGVAYKARIMPIKVLSAQGSGSVAGIADGIRWATDHGAKVINMSLGGRFNSQVLAKAVRYAHDKGVVVVCAAGNDGKGKVSFPAANSGAIAVAATQFDEGTTFYSNWGREISVSAPGGNTRLDQNGDGVPDGVMQNTVTPGNIEKQDYLLFMGTSMASPHVAGVAALLVGSGVTDPDSVRKILENTARKPAQYRGEKGKRDEHYGAGIVDAAAAVREAQAGRGERQLGVTAGLSLLLLLGLRRRLHLGLFGWAAAAAVGGGLFFLPLVPGLSGHCALTGAVLGLAASGLPGVSGAFLHAGNPLVYSAGLPLLLVALLYGQRRLRGGLAGICLGQGAVLLYTLFGSGTALSYLPSGLAALWLSVNALLCLALAALVAHRSR